MAEKKLWAKIRRISPDCLSDVWNSSNLRVDYRVKVDSGHIDKHYGLPKSLCATHSFTVNDFY